MRQRPHLIAGTIMPLCFFVSDLHGHISRYTRLFERIVTEQPQAVFIGGDILPSGLMPFAPARSVYHDFLADYLTPQFESLKEKLQEKYPRIFIILGNDDGKFEEESVKNMATRGLWEYIHQHKLEFGDYQVYGYTYVPPTPFLLKDWERYDVSRYVDPGCVSPEEGIRSVDVSIEEVRYATIAADLDLLVRADDLSRSIFLFHSPPHHCNLDRAALDGKKVDHAPLDVHVGSIAVRRLIELHRPLLTLHGHIHESARLTGSWQDRIGETYCFSAAHDGPELSLVRFDPDRPEMASRELL